MVFKKLIQNLRIVCFKIHLYIFSIMKPWEGPGKAFSFLRELNEETYADAVKKGLSPNLMIDVHAEADNMLIMTVSTFF